MDWRGIAPHLGLNDTDINQIESKRTESEKRLETLLMWKKKYGYKAKFKMLIDALLKISNAEQAEKVCQILQRPVYKGISLKERTVFFYNLFLIRMSYILYQYFMHVSAFVPAATENNVGCHALINLIITVIFFTVGLYHLPRFWTMHI